MRTYVVFPLVCAVLLASPLRVTEAQLLDFEKPWSREFAPIGTMYGDGESRGVTDAEGLLIDQTMTKMTRGIGFSGAVLVCQSGSALTYGCSSDLGANPSGTQVIRPTGATLGIEIHEGFSQRLSFWYTARNARATVSIFSDYLGNGDLLGSMSIGGNPLASCTACDWQQVALDFTGTARSVRISLDEPNWEYSLPEGEIQLKRGTYDEMGQPTSITALYVDGSTYTTYKNRLNVHFDDFRFGVPTGGPPTAVSEPSPMALLAAGVAMLGLITRQRARRSPYCRGVFRFTCASMSRSSS